MQTLVLASNNAAKQIELQHFLPSSSWTLLLQRQLGIQAAEEPHATFVENALAKARHASSKAGLPALADDSGLCLSALGGAPGVHSARFGGEPRSDNQNNSAVLSALEGLHNRRGFYYCVVVLVRHPEDCCPLIAEGRWFGEIAEAPRGDAGFGFDPLFLIPELGKTVAELSFDEKQRLSHRGQAMRSMQGQLQHLA